MQTSIKSTMGLGVPGEHANTQPYFADAYIAGEDIVMGTPVVITDGKAMKATAAVADGLAVSPHEHVLMELPSYEQSLEVKTGNTIAVAKKGCWFVAIPKDNVATAQTWTAGNYLGIVGGKLAVISSGTAFATILEADTVETELVNGVTKVAGTPVAMIRLA